MGFIYGWSIVLSNDESHIPRILVKEIIVHSKFIYDITIHGCFSLLELITLDLDF